MDVGTGLLWIGLFLAAGGALSFAAHAFSAARPYRTLAKLLLAVDSAVVTGAFLLMIHSFLAPDLSIAYVHSHTRIDYPWYYRLAGAWSGDAGSILLWAWFLSLTTVLFAFGGRKDTPSRSRLRVVGSAILSVLVGAFLYVLIAADPFRATLPAYLISEGTSDGLGLSPVLLTPLVIVHPPLEFLAYALVAVPFVASLAYLLVGRGEWTVLAMQWTRAAWLLLTLAMMIGALWAYTVLGWGGYWAWDPVETANLVLWIPLTALAHAQLWRRRKRGFSHLSVALAGVAFALTMFATFETRTGILLSVHSFTSASGVSEPDLGDRLVSTLASGGAARSFFVMMVVALLVTAASFLIFFIRLRRRQGVGSRPSLMAPVVFLWAYVAAIAWTLADAPGVARATIGAMDGLGFGSRAAGALILAGVFVGIPLAWIVLAPAVQGDEDERGRDWVSDDGAMLLGLSLFLFWAVATLGLMIAAANSLDRSAFEERLPFLLIPLGAVLLLALSWRRLGKRHAPYTLLGLGLAIVVSYVWFSSNPGALYLPLALALLLASAYWIGRLWAPAVMPRGLRIAAVLALASLLLAFVMWSSGVRRVGFAGLALEFSLPWSVLGAVGSLVGIVTLGLGISRRDWRLWIASGALGIALLGFFIGLLLSVASVLLVARSLRYFWPEEERRTVALTSILRAGSPPLIHLGVALVLLGYAASSYFAMEAQVTATTDVPTASFSGYEYRLARSSGLDLDGDGLYEVITADVSVAGGSLPPFVATLRLTWQTAGVLTPRYLPETFVYSQAAGDLSFTPLGFSDGTWTYSIDDAAPRMAVSGSLTSVVFHVRENPLMIPVWGGGWLLAVGMGIRMWSERKLVIRERVEEREGPWASPTPPERRDREEDYYRRKLAEEIGQEETP